MNIKKGDKVIVITGKDRGKSGEVTRVFPAKELVIVDGLNLVTKHRKGGTRGAGETLQVARPVHVSNVMKSETSGSKKPARKKAATKEAS